MKFGFVQQTVSQLMKQNDEIYKKSGGEKEKSSKENSNFPKCQNVIAVSQAQMEHKQEQNESLKYLLTEQMFVGGPGIDQRKNMDLDKKVSKVTLKSF